MYDLAIIGGGVAGMTAAIYAARAGINTVIIEKAGFGGQAALTAKIENYPSIKEIEGFELAANMKMQIDALGVDSNYADVTELKKADGVFTLATTDGNNRSKSRDHRKRRQRRKSWVSPVRMRCAAEASAGARSATEDSSGAKRSRSSARAIRR